MSEIPADLVRDLKALRPCAHSPALYYEGHVILRNKPEAHQQDRALGIDCIMNEADGWWYSTLHDEEGPDEAEKRGDHIVTTRGPSESVLLERMREVAKLAGEYGLRVIRYKVEVATIDSKHRDYLGILT